MGRHSDLSSGQLFVEPCQEAGSAAEQAATRKLAKYPALWAQYDFQPVAIETLGPLNESACEFLNMREHGIWKIGDYKTSFLFQQISVLVQRFNVVWLNNSFMWDRIPSFLLFLTFS